jgi:F-type H+-transporting ATPase subunit b
MPQFDTSTYSSQIFWLFFCIFFLIFFLKKILLPRIENIFQMRYYHFYDERKKIKILQDQISFLKKSNADKLEKAKQEVNEQVKQIKIALETERELYLQKIDNEMQAEILEFQTKLHAEKQEKEHLIDRNIQEYVALLQTRIVESSNLQEKT